MAKKVIGLNARTMKIYNKTAFSLGKIALLVLLLGAIMLYKVVIISSHNAIREALSSRLYKLNASVAEQQEHPNHNPIISAQVEVKLLTDTAGILPIKEVERNEWVPALRVYSPTLSLTSRHLVNGKYYLVESSFPIIEPEDHYSMYIVMVFAWLIIFLLLVFIISREMEFRKVFAPFYRVIKIIDQLSHHQTTTLEVLKSPIKEFEALNHFVEKMISRMRLEFILIKELLEDLIHELYNSLDVMAGDVDLLSLEMGSAAQKEQILSLREEIERTAMIYQTVKFLNGLVIQNYKEFSAPLLNFSEAVSKEVQRRAALCEIRHIEVRTHIQDGVMRHLHSDLCSLLLSNLFTNAVKHNFKEDGYIVVILNEAGLTIRNTGAEPAIPIKYLMERYQAANPSVKSSGIGLSIIRKICTLYNFRIEFPDYDKEGHWHEMQLYFNQNPPAS